MDNNIRKYKDYINQEIIKIEQDLKNPDSKKAELARKKIKRLSKLHQQTIRNFQHERLIHLLVTFFFAGLLLLSIAAIFLFALLPVGYNYALLSSLTLLICLFLFITEIFYVRHYYQLENGTQNLYKFSQILYDITNK